MWLHFCVGKTYMSQKEEKQYRVGEFAKNMGVSIGFLKHHEKNGLLKPRLSSSGYRYYSCRQAMQVFQCVRLQSLGFTSREIENILYHSSEKDIAELYAEKKEELQKNITRDQQILHYINAVEQYGIGTSWDGSWTIVNAPPFLYVESITNEDFSAGENGCKAIKEWNRFFPMVSTCTRVKWEGKPDGTIHILEIGRGLMIDEKIADSLQVPENPAVQRIDPGKVLHYHLERTVSYLESGEEAPVDPMLKEPLELCRRHAFTPGGDIFMIQQFASTAQDRNFVSQMIVVPIEE